ncbi:MAG: 3'-5' exonuclease [Propionibacteriaceae bacterium]
MTQQYYQQPHYGFAVVDVENTGLSPKHDRVVEIAVVQTDHWGRPEAEWSTRINPQCNITNTEIHGITNADVANAPTFADVLPYLVQMLRGRAFVAHNATFDGSFLGYEFGRAQWAWPQLPVLDTMKEAEHFLPHLPRRRLVDCSQACGIRLHNAHSALGDARATAGIVQHYFDPSRGVQPTEWHQSLVVDGVSVQWPVGSGVLTSHAPSLWEAGKQRVAIPSYAKKSPKKTKVIKPLLESLNLAELAPGARSGTKPYLEIVLQALADGQISDIERIALDDVADLYQLDENARQHAHEIVISGLCAAAVHDGIVQKIERDEIAAVAGALDVDSSLISNILKEEKEIRIQKLGENLAPLPADWNYGQPLHVGDVIAITGLCNGHRVELEELAATVGVRVSNVTKKTVLLATDGDIESQKVTDAFAAGLRIVDSQTLWVLLRHIQPAAQPKTKQGKAARELGNDL